MKILTTKPKDPGRTRSYKGAAGQLFAMSEFALRFYNVAIPQIDIGDDIFVVNDVTTERFSVQVKTAFKVEKRKKENAVAFGFTTKEVAVTKKEGPDYFFFAARVDGSWRYIFVSRQALDAFYQQDNFGTKYTSEKGITNVSFNFILNLTSRKLTCSGIDFSKYLDATSKGWEDFPPVQHPVTKKSAKPTPEGDRAR